jgi:hypothetical protein
MVPSVDRKLSQEFIFAIVVDANVADWSDTVTQTVTPWMTVFEPMSGGAASQGRNEIGTAA